jgi:hypothetical protein
MNILPPNADIAAAQIVRSWHLVLKPAMDLLEYPRPVYTPEYLTRLPLIPSIASVMLYYVFAYGVAQWIPLYTIWRSEVNSVWKAYTDLRRAMLASTMTDATRFILNPDPTLDLPANADVLAAQTILELALDEFYSQGSLALLLPQEIPRGWTTMDVRTLMDSVFDHVGPQPLTIEIARSTRLLAIQEDPDEIQEPQLN